MFKHVAVFAALALAMPAQAQDATIDPDHIISVLKDAGYPAEYFNEEMDYRQVLSKSGTYNFLVEMYDCEAGKTCNTLEFYSNFPMDTAPTKEKLDAYSGPRDGARLSLDRRGEARVQQEVDIGDSGLTDAAFIEKVKAWEQVLANVGAYLHDQPAPGATPAAAATSDTSPAAAAAEAAAAAGASDS
jgi:hypothetical protein